MFTALSLDIQENHLAHVNCLYSSHVSYKFLLCFWSGCGIYICMWYISYTHTPELIHSCLHVYTAIESFYEMELSAIDRKACEQLEGCMHY